MKIKAYSKTESGSMIHRVRRTPDARGREVYSHKSRVFDFFFKYNQISPSKNLARNISPLLKLIPTRSDAQISPQRSIRISPICVRRKQNLRNHRRRSREGAFLTTSLYLAGETRSCSAHMCIHLGATRVHQSSRTGKREQKGTYTARDSMRLYIYVYP